MAFRRRGLKEGWRNRSKKYQRCFFFCRGYGMLGTRVKMDGCMGYPRKSSLGLPLHKKLRRDWWLVIIDGATDEWAELGEGNSRGERGLLFGPSICGEEVRGMQSVTREDMVWETVITFITVSNQVHMFWCALYISIEYFNMNFLRLIYPLKCIHLWKFIYVHLIFCNL